MNHEPEVLAVAQAPPTAQPAADETSIATRARQQARRRRLLVYAARAATLLLVVGGWQLLTSWKVIDPFFFGQPSGIVARLRGWVEHGTSYGSLWLQVWITMKEALLGFAYGVAGGIVFGVLLGQVRFLADVLGPYIKAMNAVPRIVLGSIFVVWLGLGTASKVLLAAVLVFFVVFFNAFQGVREVDRNLVANARVLGASRFQVVRNVVLPSALTWIIASMHTSFGFAIVGAVVGEYLGSAHGLGNMIAVAQGTFNLNGIYGCMFILAVVALIAESLITQLENRLITWRPTRRDELAP